MESGYYQLQLLDNGGCTDSLDVELNYIFEVEANAGDDIEVCQSSLPIALAGAGTNLDQLAWVDLNGNELSGDSTLNFNDAPGVYTFILTGTNGLCDAQDTIDILVLANPTADAGPDKEVFAEEVFTIGGSPTSTVEAQYFWSPNPTQSLNTTISNPSGYLLESTDFIVLVTDLNGCVGTDTVFVKVLPDVRVTSGFTPNSDGVNDTWIIDNMELFPNNAVHVFNRWGQSVFSQTSYNSGNAWDGTYKGEKLPVGTYYYTIELNDFRFPDPITGPITIYR